MKTIGLLGGMSWESTVPYYRLINEAVRERMGGLHSARLVLFSVDFAEIEALQRAARWDDAAAVLAAGAVSLERAGAEFIVICTNTMHVVVDQIGAAVKIPILHIGDATAAAIARTNVRTVGLLGTKFTMEKAFYRERLEAAGFKVLIPEARDRDELHRIIFDELCVGRVEESSRATYRRVMDNLADAGAEGIILGCTEITLLVTSSDARVPLFDTTVIHAQAAAEKAIK